jgi:hypothetical protein
MTSGIRHSCERQNFLLSWGDYKMKGLKESGEKLISQVWCVYKIKVTTQKYLRLQGNLYINLAILYLK